MRYFNLGGDSHSKQKTGKRHCLETGAQSNHLLHRMSQVILFLSVRLQKKDKQGISKYTVLSASQKELGAGLLSQVQNPWQRSVRTFHLYIKKDTVIMSLMECSWLHY